MHLRVDRIPFEAIIGWDAAGNGNLAQVLQEPTLMGAYEGAGITVLGRGVRIPSDSTDFWGASHGRRVRRTAAYWLSRSNAIARPARRRSIVTDYGTANYLCNPSRIDGVSIINSSQGGGGIFIHGWDHNLEIANTPHLRQPRHARRRHQPRQRRSTAGVHQRRHDLRRPPGVAPCPPTGSASLIGAGTPAANAMIPFQFNTKVRIHHNMLYGNASIGDALFSGTPAGAGAITVSAGADNYEIDHNWIAGNLSTGDGGGMQHLGLSFNGKINNNYILFNQSTNPTLPTNGGGVVIEGANLDRQLATAPSAARVNDKDCPPGLGAGHRARGLVIDANLILGNSAESGSGGGLRIQQVNGSDLTTFPQDATRVVRRDRHQQHHRQQRGGLGRWRRVDPGFAEGKLVNNTIVSNDTTASAGALFKTLGAIYSASPPPGCTPTPDPTQPQNPNCLVTTRSTGRNPPGW